MTSLSYKTSVHIPNTIMNLKLIYLLYQEGYILGFFYNKKRITVFLKYTESFKPVIKNIKKISSSGKRIFISYKTLLKLQINSGLLLLNTTKGLITSKKAKDAFQIGGEVVCKII